MRVLNVRANMHPVRGAGSAERALQISRALAQRPGVEVTHLSLDLGATEQWSRKLEQVDIVTLRCINARFQLPAPSLRRLDEAVQQADVVHFIGNWSVLNALVYRRARSLGVPHVVCPAGALAIFGRSKVLKRAYNRLVGDELVRTAARHIAITEDEVPQLLAHGATVDSVRVIPNGVVAEEFEHRDDGGFRRRFGLGDAPFLLFVGRLNPIKGPDLLIEAFASVTERFPHHRLLLAGSDEGMLARLTELVERHALQQRVRFIGHISDETKSAAYHAAELLIIPSRQEAMSMVVLEAGAAATPVIATDRCGLSELGRINAAIIVPATVERIADGIAAALADPAGLRVMAEKLHAHTLDRFCWDAVGSQLVELLREVVDERARAGSDRLARDQSG